ncbi:MAG: CRTAC1 family protein, partial [Gemmataceae bacterium]|nr:CRTAC1 family protein [Gemmataceae bacterium]
DATDDFLLFNRRGKLEELGFKAGVALDDMGRATASMGVDAADFDGSGRPSLWVTCFQGELHALFRNLGQERFQHFSRAAGVNAIGLNLVGFGTSFVDLDNDGWEDLIIANGHVLRYPGQGSSVRQLPKLLHNEAASGRRIFKNLSARGGTYFQNPVVGRGLAVGDLDNDGWPDVVMHPINAPVALLRNIAGDTTAANWVVVKLVGRGYRDVVGSTVILETENSRLTRFVKGGGSYLSSSDSRIHFGLGTAAAIRRLTVKWSWGQTQSWDGLTVNTGWELREGEPLPVRLTLDRPGRPQ